MLRRLMAAMAALPLHTLSIERARRRVGGPTAQLPRWHAEAGAQVPADVVSGQRALPAPAAAHGCC